MTSEQELRRRNQRLHERLAAALLHLEEEGGQRLVTILGTDHDGETLKDFDWTQVQRKYRELLDRGEGFLLLRVSMEPKRVLVVGRFHGFQSLNVLTQPDKVARLAQPDAEVEALENFFRKGKCKSSLYWERFTEKRK
jgi:hypothetical protein